MKEEGKNWGLYKELEWIALLGYSGVIFELDCKMVVDDVHKLKPNYFEYGSLYA
jgi:hypothetical protein